MGGERRGRELSGAKTRYTARIVGLRVAVYPCTGRNAVTNRIIQGFFSRPPVTFAVTGRNKFSVLEL